MKQHSRMMFDLPAEIQMAIRLRAAKSRLTTGQVVAQAVSATFAADVREADQNQG